MFVQIVCPTLKDLQGCTEVALPGFPVVPWRVVSILSHYHGSQLFPMWAAMTVLIRVLYPVGADLNYIFYSINCFILSEPSQTLCIILIIFPFSLYLCVPFVSLCTFAHPVQGVSCPLFSSS